MTFAKPACLFGAALFMTAVPAFACGPEALGTSRIIEMSDLKGRNFGTAQHEPLPLAPGEVVLTFDDGPRAETTPLVLKALRDECVTATFFMVGNNIEKNPALARDVLKDGHAIGLHSATHRKQDELTPAEQIADFEWVQKMADTTLSGQAAPAYRFPNLVETPELMAHLKSLGYNVMSIDLSIEDWVAGETPQSIDARLFTRLETAKSGLILMHDAQNVTAAATPHILRSLKERGYKVVALRWTKPAP